MPGHWRSYGPEFARATGRSSTASASSCPPPTAGARRWITFDGIFYQADVWLDGAYLGDPEGYFFPHSFDVTRPVAARRRPRAGRRGDVQPGAGHEPVGATSPACSSTPRPSTGTGTRAASGARCSSTTPARSSSTACACCAATPTRPAPTSACTPALDSDVARTVRVRTSADGVVVGETEHPLAAGANEIEWSLDVDRPRLWWPHALGDQPLTDDRRRARSSTARSATAGRAAPGCARWRGTTGSARSTASGCS